MLNKIYIYLFIFSIIKSTLQIDNLEMVQG